MLLEEHSTPSSRYLFTYWYWSDEAIKLLQNEIRDRPRKTPKDEAYFKFMNWKRKENEIAVYTLYAYADLLIPKTFNRIFDCENGEILNSEPYKITQSVWNAYIPIDSIEDGHKHVNILEFEKKSA